MSTSGRDISLAQLKAFAAYAASGSFVGAGSATGKSGTAMSKSLRLLEHATQLQLVDRKGAATTALGQQLLPRVQDVLDAVEALESAALGLRGVEVTINCLSVHLESRLTEVLHAFDQELRAGVDGPGFRFKLIEVAPEDGRDLERVLFEPLKRGLVHVAVGGEAHEGFESKTLYTTRVIVACPDDDALRDVGTIDLKRIDRPLLVLGPGFFSRDRIQQALGRPELQHLRIAHELPTARAMHRFAAMGFGLPLMATDALDPPPPGRPYPVVHVGGAPISQEVCIHRQKHSSNDLLDQFWTWLPESSADPHDAVAAVASPSVSGS